MVVPDKMIEALGDRLGKALEKKPKVAITTLFSNERFPLCVYKMAVRIHTPSCSMLSHKNGQQMSESASRCYEQYNYRMFTLNWTPYCCLKALLQINKCW